MNCVKLIIAMLTAYSLSACTNDLQFSSALKQNAATDSPTDDPDTVRPPIGEPPQPQPLPVPPPIGEQPLPTPTPTPVPVPEPTPSPTPTPVPPPIGEPPQPTPTPVVENETFDQKVNGGQVDIVMVIDNSDSMFVDHYYEIAKRFTGFINTLNGLDYRIAVTTSDMTNNGQLDGFLGKFDIMKGTNRKWIDSRTTNAEKILLDTIHRQESINCRLRAERPCGSNYEEPLKAMYTAINLRDADNKGFFRDSAALYMIALSDEDEGLEDGDRILDLVEPQELVNQVRNSFGAQKQFYAQGVMIVPEDKDCRKKQRKQELFGQEAEYGTFLHELGRLTGGSSVSMCDANYSSQLKVAEKVSQGNLSTRFTLAHDPIAGSVQVTLVPASQNNFHLDGRTMVFDHAPAAGTQIRVSYQRLP